MDPLIILFIAVLNFLVAFFAASVGGSGLIMTPVLISLGIPPPSAIAAKRFSNLGLASFSLVKFHKAKKVIWRIGIPLIAISVLAGYLGATFVLSVDEALLQRIIGTVILGTLIFMIVNRGFGLKEKARKLRKRNKAAGGFFYFLARLVSQISGGGGGIFSSHVLIYFFGLTFLQSAGTRKVSGLLGTAVATSVYILAAAVPFEIAIPMLVAGSAGGWIGSHYAIKKGDEWVRKLFMVLIAALGVYLLVF